MTMLQIWLDIKASRKVCIKYIGAKGKHKLIVVDTN